MSFNQLTQADNQKREAVYLSALALVQWIEAALTLGRVHFRNAGGRLLTNLDEVIRAIENNELAAVNNEQ